MKSFSQSLEIHTFGAALLIHPCRVFRRSDGFPRIRGEARISVKDDRVYANGFEIERNPIIQARAQKRWLSELLLKSTGKKFHVDRTGRC
ncbi:MAG TPA: hypothetical protein VMN57_05495 [Anaerolineales bacterium]|nr:hypothetical protein [Anaerolineales bacterium]